MKKITYYFSLLLVGVFLFTSCENEQLTGEFFTTPDGQDIVIGDGDPDSETCQDAFTALATAEAAFAAATEENYTTVCSAYSQALLITIEACGDSSGDLQAMVNELGDCSSFNACAQAQSQSSAAAVALQNDPDNNDLCLAYKNALQNEIIACGDTSGDLQDIIDQLDCGEACIAAQETAEEFQIIFDAVDPLDEDAYTVACADYSLALQEVIDLCGDADGSLLAIVQELGDCSPPEQPGPLQVTIDGEFKNFNTAEVTVVGSTINIIAKDLDTDDTFVFSVVLLQTGDNVLQDEVMTLTLVDHFPFIAGDTPYTNNVSTNDGSQLIGTFSGSMEAADGTLILLTDGTFDIEI